jgi:hypothetical protein
MRDLGGDRTSRLVALKSWRSHHCAEDQGFHPSKLGALGVEKSCDLAF